MTEMKGRRDGNEHDAVLRQIHKSLETVQSLPPSELREAMVSALESLCQWLLAAGIILQASPATQHPSVEYPDIIRAWQQVVTAKQRLIRSIEEVETALIRSLQTLIDSL